MMDVTGNNRVSRRGFMQVAGGSAAMALLAACVPTGAPTVAPQPGTDGQPTPEMERGTLIGLYGQDIRNFSPITGTQGFQAQWFFSVMPQLVLPNNEKSDFIPVMVESWDVSDDGTQYTFHIHPNARWHDGADFTADDVAFTYHLYLHPATRSARAGGFSAIQGAAAYTNGEADMVSGIEVLDAKTLCLTLDAPSATFLFEIGSNWSGILPKHILGDVAPDQLETNPFMFESPLGYGPFKFVERVTDQYVRLEANDDWHWGKPKLAGYIMRVVSSPDAAVIALERREGHFNAWGIGISPEVADSFMAQDGYKVIATTGATISTYTFNMRLDFWADKRTRQAWWHALDRRRIVEAFAQGNGKIYNTPLAHDWAIPDDLNPYEYDPALARQLLEESGWDFNREITILTSTITSENGRAQIAAEQQMLQAAGFNVSIEELDSSIATERFYRTYDYHVFRSGPSTFHDPDPFIKFHLIPGGNYATGYADYIGGDFEEKARLAGTLSDQAARRDIYFELSRILNDNPPIVTMHIQNEIFVFDDRVVIPGITDQRQMQSGADASNPLPAKRYWWTNLHNWEFRG